jgi:hypothetical protein
LDVQGESSCIACPSGTYNEDYGKPAVSDCLYIPEGKYGSRRNEDGGVYQVSDDLCDGGRFCPGGSAMPNDHPDACAAGTSCRGWEGDTYYGPKLCDAGTYTDASGLTACKACRMGTFQNNEGGAGCIPCGSGRWHAVEASVTEGDCLDIAAGSYATKWTSKPDAVFAISSNACVPGTHCAGKWHQPSKTECGDGDYCPGFVDGVYKGVVPCDAGKFSTVEGTSECTSCPAGTFQDGSGSNSCTGCGPARWNPATGSTEEGACLGIQPGTYALSFTDNDPEAVAEISSASCLPGYECLGGAAQPSQELCVPGRFCPGGATASAACPAGTFSDDEHPSECESCGVGTFGDVEEMTACEACGVDRYNGGLGADEESFCLDIPAGYYASDVRGEGAVAAISSDDCVPGKHCPGGRFLPSDEACEEGKYCPAWTSGVYVGPTNCLAGSFTDVVGASVCTPCAKGTYLEDEGQVECLPCGTARYSGEEGNDDEAACRDIEVGYAAAERTANDVIISVSKATCVPGTHCPGGSAVASSDLCPAGTYCPAWSSGVYVGPTPCPAGTYTSTSGRSVCEPCPVGTYQDANGQAFCHECGAARYNTLEGQSSENACRAIPMGWYGVRTDEDNIDVVEDIARDGCLPGWHCPGGAAFPSQGECPAGVACAAWGTDDVAAATGTYSPPEPCALGMFNGEAGQPACTPCSVGRFEDAVGSPACKACGAARYNTQEGSTTEAACLAIEVGYYGVPLDADPEVIADVARTECKPGWHCPGGAAFPSQAACIRGTVCAAWGAEDEGNFGASYSSPEACAAGSIAAEDGMSACEACSAGRYQDAEGQSICIDCPAGKYNEDEHADLESACSPVPAGFYSSSFSGEDRSAAFAISNVLCIPGKYCPGGHELPTPCAVGWHQPGQGEPACEPCSAGTFQDAEGQPACEPCSAGRFQPRLAAGSCGECPPWSYTDQEGKSSCQVIASGYYGTMADYDCPAGSQSEEDSEPVERICLGGTTRRAAAAPTTRRTRRNAGDDIAARPGQVVNDLFWDCGDVAADDAYCSGKVGDCSSLYTLASDIGGVLAHLQGECPAACGLCPEGGEGFSYRLPCPKGHSCAGGIEQPDPCPPGTAEWVRGSDQCRPCTAASYAPGFGGINCEVMPSGGFGVVEDTVIVTYVDRTFHERGPALAAVLDVLRAEVVDYEATVIGENVVGENKAFEIKISGLPGAREVLDAAEATRTRRTNETTSAPWTTTSWPSAEPAGFTAFWQCPRGMFCIGGERTPCPAATYQILAGQPDCEDIPPGYVGTNDGGDLGANLNITLCPETLFCINGNAEECGSGYRPNQNRSECVAIPVAEKSSSEDDIASPTNLAAVGVCLVVVIVVIVMVVKRSKQNNNQKNKKMAADANAGDVKYNPVYSPFDKNADDSGDEDGEGGMYDSFMVEDDEEDDDFVGQADDGGYLAVDESANIPNDENLYSSGAFGDWDDNVEEESTLYNDNGTAEAAKEDNVYDYDDFGDF